MKINWKAALGVVLFWAAVSIILSVAYWASHHPDAAFAVFVAAVMAITSWWVYGWVDGRW